MFQDWRRDRLTKRVKPGDGRPLKRFRWWQLLTRGLMHLRITGEDGRPADYAVSVGYLGDSKTGEVVARLYLDGRLHAESKTPAVFPVPGGVIEVATSAFGLKRCHYVTEGGAARQLVPDPRSAEGRRARFDGSHPVWSRWIGVISLILIAIGVVLVLLELADRHSAGGREHRGLRLARAAAAVAHDHPRGRSRGGQYRAGPAAEVPVVPGWCGGLRRGPCP